MGNFTAKITLKNTGDMTKDRDGFISGQNVRQVTIEAIPAPGASTLFIGTRRVQYPALQGVSNNTTFANVFGFETCAV